MFNPIICYEIQLASYARDKMEMQEEKRAGLQERCPLLLSYINNTWSGMAALFNSSN
jgi:hypothetical protein